VSFAGFSPVALRFLAGLAENNEKAWFDGHRDEYEEHLLEPARNLVVAIGERFHDRGVDVHAVPKVGGSLMRINRDTRFAKDKRPYKTHLDLWFWQGSGHSRRAPGYWFRLTPQTLLLGAGMHHFEPDRLERFREAVVDRKHGPALLEALDKVRRHGIEIGGERYKRLPRGYEPLGDERDRLLLHDGLFVWTELDVPPEVHTPSFPDVCVSRYLPMRPVQDWLLGAFAD